MNYFQQRSKSRLKDACYTIVLEKLHHLKSKDNSVFLKRFEAHFDPLISSLYEIYGDQYDFSLHIQQLSSVLVEAWQNRENWLKKSDVAREADSSWFNSSHLVGAVCYVDLFNGTFSGLENKIDYLKELGISYLHLMPLFSSPENENDGGYAVSSYRNVDERLGSLNEFKKLIKCLRKADISLVLDFVNNHTSDEHKWAISAKKGDSRFQNFYYLFEDRTIPDVFEKNLREIFPEVRRGNFTWSDELNRWVWTTFHNYQWDLNYRNPDVFVAMAKEMLFLANLGVDVLRLDAVPFTWKEFGTSCENLPQAHAIIKALNSCARIVAPGLIFKSEAIVHPDDVIKYVSPNKCQISYNPTAMALSWEALATREVKLLVESLKYRFSLPENTSWVNYVRSHDDIGWTFSDDDAYRLGINGYDHRRFLNLFYSGDFPGGFARGYKFQFNPSNGDLRICGTTASLAGLDNALLADDEGKIKDSINRILLLYALSASIGGIPLLYLGDEIGSLNDTSFLDNPGKAHDARWVHRPTFNWDVFQQPSFNTSPQASIYNGIKDIFNVRKHVSAFSKNAIDLKNSHHKSVLSFVKKDEKSTVLCLFNFSEHEARIMTPPEFSGVRVTDLITKENTSLDAYFSLKGYDFKWLTLGDG